MNKKLLYLIPFMAALLVLTVEKAVASKRKFASLNSYQNHSKNQIPVSNKGVSAVVLVENEKPICTLSVAQDPHLVPESVKVDPQQNTLDLKLPQCSQEEASMIKSTIEEAIVLDKHGGYRTAGPPIALGVASWCLIGISSSRVPGWVMSKEKKEELIKKSLDFRGIASSIFYVIGDFKMSPFMKSLGIAGFCSIGTDLATVYLFAE